MRLRARLSLLFVLSLAPTLGVTAGQPARNGRAHALLQIEPTV